MKTWYGSLVKHDFLAYDARRPDASPEPARLHAHMHGTLAVPLRHRPATLTVLVLIVTLALAGCGGGGVSSTTDAEAWLRNKFTTDVIEVNDVSCEKAPGDSYLCSMRAVTRVGATTFTGYLDCANECAWRPYGND